MTDMPAEFSIQSQINGQPSDFVKIEIRDHQRLLASIVLAPSDALVAVLNAVPVTCSFTDGRAA